MKKLAFLTLLVLIVVLSGCATKQQLQTAIYSVDSFWKDTNEKYLFKHGNRSYFIGMNDTEKIVIKTMQSLGFSHADKRKSESEIMLFFRAISPAPLTKEEYEKVKYTEEPIMQAIAAESVGKFTANMFKLSNNDDFEVAVTIFLFYNFAITDIKLNFNMNYRKPNSYLVYGKQPPPEAVKISIGKFWHKFEEQANLYLGKQPYQFGARSQ